MYHRFNENKYPSTNVRNEIFLEHIKEINRSKIEFISFEKFKEVMKDGINKNYILLTIDDAFESFYVNAWPVLKMKKIPLETIYNIIRPCGLAPQKSKAIYNLSGIL